MEVEEPARELLRRELFPRAAILEPLAVSVPASEITDGGREPILGVVNIAESRRCPTLDGCAGVDPAVPRTPILRLIWVEKEQGT